MQRLAFKMKLKPGCEAEYEKRHARLWPEMKLLLKEGGIGNYSIFTIPTPSHCSPIRRSAAKVPRRRWAAKPSSANGGTT